MANYFLDEFTGSGAIATHTPDLEFGAGAWNPDYNLYGGLTLSGGVASPVLSGGVYSKSRYQSPTAGASPTFKFGFDLNIGNQSATSVVFESFLIADGCELFCSISYSGGAFLLTLRRNGIADPGLSGYAMAGLSLSTSSVIGSITHNNVAKTITLTVGGHEYTASTSGAYTPTTGVTDMELTLGTGNSLNSISVGTTGGDGTALLPAATVNAYGGASAALNLPTPTAVAVGHSNTGIGNMNPTLPLPQIFGSGHDSAGERAFDGYLPMPALSSFGGANSELSAPPSVLSASATFWGFGGAELTGPSAVISASGTVSATAGAALSAPMAKLVGYFGAVASITLTDGYTVQATGTLGSIGGASIVAPLYELTATGTVHGLSHANLLAPAAKLGATAQAWIIVPGASLTAIGHAVVTATYEAYALNLNHINTDAAVDEVTRYTNFPFTQIVRYQGSYFGVAADGLYLLEGTTDDGDAIPWEFMTTLSDFKSPFLKTVVSAYFGGRMGPAATVHLQAGEDAAKTYSYATTRSDHAQNYRQKFGRGLDSRYFAVGASGTGTLELDNIELNIQKSNRRI